MAKLMVLYNKPTDVAAFDAYYLNKHVPMAKTHPGAALLRSQQGRDRHPKARPRSTLWPSSHLIPWK